MLRKHNRFGLLLHLLLNIFLFNIRLRFSRKRNFRRRAFCYNGCRRSFYLRPGLRFQSPGCLSVLDGSLNHLGQAFQSSEVALFESIGSVRQKLEYSIYFLLPHERHYHHGRNSQEPATLLIHARVGFRIVAAQNLSRPHTLTGESRVHLQARSQFGR